MDIRSMYRDELAAVIAGMGEKPFRAKQLFSWLHEKQAASYEEMTDLPSALRNRLAEGYPLVTLKEAAHLVSEKDGTEKFLFELEDHNVIESVLMRYHHGNSVCISSQVGCAMGCLFCASTKNGLVRSLTASEMLEQVYRIRKASGERVANVVVMGMGEPLQNYDALLRFIKLVSDEQGINISQRNLTVSTCGLVPQIKKLAEEKLAVTLALSLHASTDEEREKLMPVAKKYKLAEVISAMKEYFEVTGRRVTFEYALVSGQNDSEEDAKRLSVLLKGFPCHVNLIPVNDVTESGLKKPGRRDIDVFHKKLEKYGINVTIRREMGADINGACGQLRNSFIERLE
ncbi:MAG: 23S rRNA (adenine(2503)-C(2))-methyltransferase RlmN [Lachnospiraceae bacterium]|nr:23S rRNA (adenine(2503)-C(2))-methyltransferase RlmN [Lachnospiraceae bacterium]